MSLRDQRRSAPSQRAAPPFVEAYRFKARYRDALVISVLPAVVCLGLRRREMADHRPSDLQAVALTLSTSPK
jgi:hypothetical protein